MHERRTSWLGVGVVMDTRVAILKLNTATLDPVAYDSVGPIPDGHKRIAFDKVRFGGYFECHFQTWSISMLTQWIKCYKCFHLQSLILPSSRLWTLQKILSWWGGRWERKTRLVKSVATSSATTRQTIHATYRLCNVCHRNWLSGTCSQGQIITSRFALKNTL